jgi:hypothetical protein
MPFSLISDGAIIHEWIFHVLKKKTSHQWEVLMPILTAL